MIGTLKFIVSVFVSFVVYTGLFVTLGSYFIGYYFRLDPDTFRPPLEQFPLLLVINLINGLLFAAGFFLLRRGLPGSTPVRQGVLYGALVHLFGGALAGMFYPYVFVVMHPAVASAWAACLLLGGVINGALTGLVVAGSPRNRPPADSETEREKPGTATPPGVS